MMENKSVSYKLNRFFQVFTNPKSLILLAVFNVVLVILLVYFCINGLFVEGICVFLTVNTILILDRFFHSPKRLVLSSQSLEFDEFIHLRPRPQLIFTFIRGSFFWLKVSYTVTNIEEVEFQQNSFEKIFDIGRISFKGKATFTAKRDLDRIPEKNTFTVYGIPRFSEFQDFFQ